MRILLFNDYSTALKFIRRHRDKIVNVIVVVNEDGKEPSKWKAAIKSNYNVTVASGMIILYGS